jgi:small-conductance mechanosensitive channel
MTISKTIGGLSAAIILCLLTLTGYAAQESPALPEATLSLMNREVITFRSSLSGAPPATRVERARQRISQITEAEFSQPIRTEPFSLGVAKGEQILLGSRQLFAVLEGDLTPDSGESLETLTRRTVALLNELRGAYLEQRSWPKLLEGIGLSLAATLLLGFSLWLLWRGTRFITIRLDRIREAYEAATTIIEWQEFAARLGVRLLWLLQWIVVLFFIYTWAMYVLNRFPLTSPLGRHLGEFVLKLLTWLGSGVVSAVPGLITIGVVFFLTRSVVELLGLFFSRVQAGTVQVPFLHAETVSATRQIVTVIVWGVGIAIAYPYIPGASSAAFKGLSVMFGLMISLGSTGLMTQMMSGLVVVYSRALRKGDFVSVGGNEGIVVEIGALATKLTNLKNEEITIPNSVLVGNSIRNYSRLAEGEGAVISTKVTIGYDAPWRQVHAMFIIAAELTKGVKQEPKPFVLQRALSDFYVEYELFVHIDNPMQRFHILTELHANIQDQFNEYEVQIMSPNFENQPDKPVLSPKESWFAAPARHPGERQ